MKEWLEKERKHCDNYIGESIQDHEEITKMGIWNGYDCSACLLTNL